MTDRINRYCSYFPCHDGLEDCTFCYCPFYPCGDTSLGDFVMTKKGVKVWSCQRCNRVHKKKAVNKIFHMIRDSALNHRPPAVAAKFSGTGIIILGHGSNLKKANNTVREVAKDIISSKIGAVMVEPAYLQLSRPGLRKTIEKMVEAGCKKVIVVPFFLFTGNHVTRDIPRVIGQAAKIYKGVEFVYAKSLGQDRRISDIVMDRIREAAR